MPAKAADPAAKNQRMERKLDLEFPVGRIGRMLKRGSYFGRISLQTPIYLASVLELLTGEVLDLAAVKAKEEGRQRIVPTNIFSGIQHDKGLVELFSNIIISEGGFNDNIPEELLHLKKRSKSRSQSQAQADTADNSRSQSNSKKEKKASGKKDDSKAKEQKEGKGKKSGSKSRSKSKSNPNGKAPKSQKTSQAV